MKGWRDERAQPIAFEDDAARRRMVSARSVCLRAMLVGVFAG